MIVMGILALGWALLAAVFIARVVRTRALDRDDPAKRAVAKLDELSGLTGMPATIFFARRELELEREIKIMRTVLIDVNEKHRAELETVKSQDGRMLHRAALRRIAACVVLDVDPQIAKHRDALPLEFRAAHGELMRVVEDLCLLEFGTSDLYEVGKVEDIQAAQADLKAKRHRTPERKLS